MNEPHIKSTGWRERGTSTTKQRILHTPYTVTVIGDGNRHMLICIVKCIDGNDDDQMEPWATRPTKKKLWMLKWNFALVLLVWLSFVGIFCYYFLFSFLSFSCFFSSHFYFLLCVCVCSLGSLHCSPKCRIYWLQYEPDGNDCALKVSGFLSSRSFLRHNPPLCKWAKCEPRAESVVFIVDFGCAMDCCSLTVSCVVYRKHKQLYLCSLTGKEEEGEEGWCIMHEEWKAKRNKKW